MKPTDLPHRFREKAFRNYEDAIALAVRAYPDVTTFYPEYKGLSPVTFSCRLRDAMKSLRENKWATRLVDTAKFLEADIVVVERGAAVIAGSKKALENGGQAYVSPTLPLSGSGNEVMMVSSYHEAELLAKLAHKRLLGGRVLIKGLTQDDVQNLEGAYDIALDLQADGSYLLT